MHDATLHRYLCGWIKVFVFWSVAAVLMVPSVYVIVQLAHQMVAHTGARLDMVLGADKIGSSCTCPEVQCVWHCDSECTE